MYRIWVTVYKDGKFVGRSVSPKMYLRKGNAERVARNRYTPFNGMTFDWVVSENNPFCENVNN